MRRSLVAEDNAAGAFGGAGAFALHQLVDEEAQPVDLILRAVFHSWNWEVANVYPTSERVRL